ncbi:hypothetical protein ACIQYL_02880 [Lysinibacillus xylanilyticus]|uniref:hypothetical protein n=1 Tax=Lysinibacillus xylanilyticus TaxID=582475 RepID=UPI00380B1DC9
MLKDKSSASLQAAAVINAEYKKRKGRALDISEGSLSVEILGHVYPDRIGNTIKKLPLPGSIEDAIDKILKRTEVIDCGESSKDSNRFLWDFLYNTASNLILV